MKKGTELVRGQLTVMITEDIKEGSEFFEGVVTRGDIDYKKGEFSKEWGLIFFHSPDVIHIDDRIVDIVLRKRGEDNEPLDGDQVDKLIEEIKEVIKQHEGNK